MEQLQFDTGVKEYCINEKAVIRINPTDTSLVKQIFDAFTALSDKQDEYKRKVESAKDGTEAFMVAEEMDKEMRNAINEIFGDNFCDDLFGRMNLYAIGDGLPVWFNFLECIMNNLDRVLVEEQKKTNPRIEKYMKKYHR